MSCFRLVLGMLTCLTSLLTGLDPVSAEEVVTGDLRQWHRVTVTFDGPEASESDSVTFRDYRLDVTFTHTESGTSTVVPGFFSADGNAGESAAEHGNKWRVHFSPDRVGEWAYAASFRRGKDIALRDDPQAGQATGFDGATGIFTVDAAGPPSRDFRTRGRLNSIGQRYLQFSRTGERFLKAGADSPENLLGYAAFDGTYRHSTKSARGEAKLDGDALHRYEPHVRDWQDGDPTWGDGKGKGLIGALNYLASEEMNSVYFLTMNVTGDGKDVWPWVAHDIRDRFDCSKLDQWEIVFSHMDRLGLLLHVITQETENDQLLDGGELGLERKLYYRELIARFAHHPALIWNLGEENTNTTRQQKAFCEFIKQTDPYDHPIVVHTYPNKHEDVYQPLLGFDGLDGLSVQTSGNVSIISGLTADWTSRSRRSGHSWFVCIDEPGSAGKGVTPDGEGNNHREMIHHALWGNLLAGGSGVEWYFGYQFPHNDLNCEDWRSRDHLWDMTRHAVTFFHESLPFSEMSAANDLTSPSDAYCFAKPGEVYAVFCPGGADVTLRLSAGTYSLDWFDVESGGELQRGRALTGGEQRQPVSLGDPPERDRDWVALVRQR